MLIIPITGLDERAMEERLEHLRSIARPETIFDYVQIEEGPPAIESAVDHATASAEVIKYVEEAEASLMMAEVAVELGLRPSRIAYPKYPPSHRTHEDA